MANFLALATFFCTIGLMTWKSTFPVIEKVRNPYSALKTDMEYRISILCINPLTGGQNTYYWFTPNISEFITPNIHGKNLGGASKTPPNSFNYLEGHLHEFLIDSNGGKLPHTNLTMSKCYSPVTETQIPSRPRKILHPQYKNLSFNNECKLNPGKSGHVPPGINSHPSQDK